ncbi:MAG: hypothetical protein RCG15_07500 [Candidatus Rickettsia vulgarisii]
MDVNALKLRGINRFLVVCNDDNIIQTVKLIIESNKLLEIHKLLSEKYEALNKSAPDFGKNFQFVDGDSMILLDAPHVKCQMTLAYITKELLNIFQDSRK